jgi:outer membrane protein assembly factor BamB
MRLLVALLVLLALVGCEEEMVEPEPGTLQAYIVSPLATDSVFDRDTVLFMGEATATDVGLLPEDSVWWTGETIGSVPGRMMRHIVRLGRVRFVFHAQYEDREDSVSVDLDVAESVGRVIWEAPIRGGNKITLGPGGVVYALESDGESSHRIIAIGPGGVANWHSETFKANYRGFVALGSDGTIYIPHAEADVDQEGGVLAFNSDGTRRWTFFTEHHGPPGSPTYRVEGSLAVAEDGSVYFVSTEADAPMYGLHPDGSLKWRVPIGAFEGDPRKTFQGSTVLVGDTLAVAIHTHDSIFAVDTRTGVVEWSASLPYSGYRDWMPAVSSDGTIYAARYRAAAAFTPSGEVIWRRELGYFVDSGMTIGRENLYMANCRGGYRILNMAGDPVAEVGDMDASFGRAVTLGANGVIYLTHGDSLYSYNEAGELRFATQIDAAAYFGVVLGEDGTVYSPTVTGVAAVRDTVGPATDAPWPTHMGGPQRRGRTHSN